MTNDENHIEFMPGEDFNNFVLMKEDGVSAAHAYEISVKNGMDFGQRVRMLRYVYSLSIEDVKVAMHGGEISQEFWDGISKAIEEVERSGLP